MASSITFDNLQTPKSKKRTASAPGTGKSFERLFGSAEPRQTRPKQLKLSTTMAVQQKKLNTPLPVSPLTGHVIGTGGSQVVDIPIRSVRSPLGGRHSPLW
eukprot:GFUD01122846.1.p1 GENE.GFUD01122846.1~~GFUD01122846.1.p1  ORF type:complete len:110 (+),score=19.46 GFUD01122846.1:30-332(+)